VARKIPWEQIRLEYVQGVERDGQRVYPTQRELAAQYNIATSVIGRKAKRDSWTAQRDIFVSKLGAQSEQKTIEAISDDASEFNLLTFQAAQLLSQHIVQHMQTKPSPSEAQQLASALRQAQQVGRLALGETTDEQGVRGGIKLEDWMRVK
jgi:hypothetical protein